MPNRSTHVGFGAVSGFATAAYRARSAPTLEALAEVLGGLVFGAIGGVAPDVLEPAVNPNHRNFAHSIAMGGGLMLFRVGEMQLTCRNRADAAQQRALLHAVGCPERDKHLIEALLWRFIAGAAIGFVVGYASHLVLDATTKKGLPLIGLSA